MADVWIPAPIQSLAGGRKRVRVAGSTVRQVIQNLDEEYPGMKEALCPQGEIVPGIAVIIDGEVANMGVLEQVREDSEVHFLPAVGGG